MTPIMTPEQRDQLIQRHYDGETIGNEARQAEALLESDPEAQLLLENLRSMSDFIRTDIAAAVADEDFSSYWTDIHERLPKGPLTLETGEERERAFAAADVVVREVEMKPPQRTFWRWLRGPGLALAGTAAVIVAMFVPGLFGLDYMVPSEPAVATNVDHTAEIGEIDSDGLLVMVTQESPDAPGITWITESEEI
jgi:anti-sigma factor RsiW